MRPPIRVIVVDDHALVRDGLIRLLEQAPSIQPVGQAGSGQEAVDLAREAQPDVALVDLRMPDMDGIETAQRLQEVCPGVRVLILTGVESEDALIRALGVGVYGYVPKALPFEAVVQSIELAVHGGVTFPYQFSQGVVTRSTQRAEPEAYRPLSHALTDRERQILQGIAAGESNRQIAGRLVISEHTVRAHLRNLMRKLGVQNRAQAAALVGTLAGDDANTAQASPHSTFRGP